MSPIKAVYDCRKCGSTFQKCCNHLSCAEILESWQKHRHEHSTSTLCMHKGRAIRSCLGGPGVGWGSGVRGSPGWGGGGLQQWRWLLWPPVSAARPKKLRENEVHLLLRNGALFFCWRYPRRKCDLQDANLESTRPRRSCTRLWVRWSRAPRPLLPLAPDSPVSLNCHPQSRSERPPQPKP